MIKKIDRRVIDPQDVMCHEPEQLALGSFRKGVKPKYIEGQYKISVEFYEKLKDGDKDSEKYFLDMLLGRD